MRGSYETLTERPSVQKQYAIGTYYGHAQKNILDGAKSSRLWTLTDVGDFGAVCHLGAVEEHQSVFMFGAAAEPRAIGPAVAHEGSFLLIDAAKGGPIGCWRIPHPLGDVYTIAVLPTGHAPVEVLITTSCACFIATVNIDGDTATVTETYRFPTPPVSLAEVKTEAEVPTRASSDTPAEPLSDVVTAAAAMTINTPGPTPSIVCAVCYLSGRLTLWTRPTVASTTDWTIQWAASMTTRTPPVHAVASSGIFFIIDINASVYLVDPTRPSLTPIHRTVALRDPMAVVPMVREGTPAIAFGCDKEGVILVSPFYAGANSIVGGAIRPLFHTSMTDVSITAMASSLASLDQDLTPTPDEPEAEEDFSDSSEPPLPTPPPIARPRTSGPTVLVYGTSQGDVLVQHGDIFRMCMSTNRSKTSSSSRCADFIYVYKVEEDGGIVKNVKIPLAARHVINPSKIAHKRETNAGREVTRSNRERSRLLERWGARRGGPAVDCCGVGPVPGGVAVVWAAAGRVWVNYLQMGESNVNWAALAPDG